jgi:hypothetical protein
MGFADLTVETLTGDSPILHHDRAYERVYTGPSPALCCQVERMLHEHFVKGAGNLHIFLRL